MRILDDQIREALKERAEKLEQHFGGDLIHYYGPIYSNVEKGFRDFIEKVKTGKPHEGRLILFLNTSGGSAETVEKLVNMIRFHYAEVYFVVPDYAISAGTIFCMSGNKIFMDYSSSLGPIDPQVFNGKEYVPALGYLDQVGLMIEKSKKKQLSDAELVMLQNLDLAMLRRFEQARDLTISLLKKWLVEYKFNDWTVHSTTPAKKGQPVTKEEKEARAEEIANALSDNKLWHSHGRMIAIGTLSTVLKLKIEDYSHDAPLRSLIRHYNDFLVEYVQRQNYTLFLHNKNYF
jgi:hypothetical protein